jgi:hypothetical protein
MRLSILWILSLVIVLCFNSSALASGMLYKKVRVQSQDSVTFVSPFQVENERCFKCHGQSRYEYTNPTLGRIIKEPMFSERIIHRNDFYCSNHKSFSCTDCHSEEYVNFPHKGELRMEQKFNCLDCHGGDEKYAKYSFEAIDSGYLKSVHYKLEPEGFNCWKCHDPHKYKISNRTSENLKETILYDNNICLKCHSDYERFQLLSDREEINILKKHEWLPNQAAHFKNVRCIECHTKINNNILVSHEILPMDKAVRLCNECHSKNSMLMASLYKFKSKEQRRDGFLNGIIMNESYVIGANRNKYLNLFSIVIFLFVIGIIGIHIIFRAGRS